MKRTVTKYAFQGPCRHCAVTCALLSLCLLAQSCDDVQATDSVQRISAATGNATVNVRPASAAPVPEPNRPHLHVEPAILDLGPVQKGQTARGAVSVTNHFDQSVTIKSSTSCGCTVADVPTRPLEPGERVEVEVRFRPTGSVGKVTSKSVRFQADGIDEPSSMTVKATLAELVTIDPLWLDVAKDGDKVVMLRSTDGTAFRITKVVPNVFETPDAGQSSTEHALDFDDAAWQRESVPDRVAIFTDHPGVASLTLNIDRNIAPQRSETRRTTTNQLSTHGVISQSSSTRGEALQIRPTRLTLGEIIAHVPKSLELLLLDQKAIPGVAPIVTCNAPNIDARVVQWREDRQGMRITVALVANGVGNSRVRTGLDISYGQATSRIDLRGLIADAPIDTSVAAALATDSTKELQSGTNPAQ